MKLRSFVFVAAIAAAFLVQDRADAQIGTAAPQVTFDAVTSYSTGAVDASTTGFLVTGIQHGASAPSTVTFTTADSSYQPAQLEQSCERQLLVAINRPGRVSFSVSLYDGTVPPTGKSGPFGVYGCSLTQLP